MLGPPHGIDGKKLGDGRRQVVKKWDTWVDGKKLASRGENGTDGTSTVHVHYSSHYDSAYRDGARPRHVLPSGSWL